MPTYRFLPPILGALWQNVFTRLRPVFNTCTKLHAAD